MGTVKSRLLNGQYQELEQGFKMVYLHKEHLQDVPFQVLMKVLKLLKDAIFLASYGSEFPKLFAPYLVLLVLGISNR